MKRYEKILNLERRNKNRWDAAGITGREAIQLYEMWKKMDKIMNKKNLYDRYANKLAEAQDNIRDLLEMSGRLK